MTPTDKFAEAQRCLRDAPEMEQREYASLCAQVYASLAIAEELREIRKELRRSDDDLNEAFRELMRRTPGV